MIQVKQQKFETDGRVKSLPLPLVLLSYNQIKN